MKTSETSEAAAIAIYQDLLDRISKSYVENDFDAYAQMLRVPHVVTTFEKVIRLETQQDLRTLFDTMASNLMQKGISDYLRTCLAADFTDPDTIVGAHETRLMDGAHVLEQPYPVKSILRLIDGNWWVCESDNAIDPTSSIGRVLENVQAKRPNIGGSLSDKRRENGLR